MNANIERIKNKLQLIHEVLESSNGELNALELDFSLAKLVDVYEDLLAVKQKQPQVRVQEIEKPAVTPRVQQVPEEPEIMQPEAPALKVQEFKKVSIESVKQEASKPVAAPSAVKVAPKEVSFRIALNDKFEYIREVFESDKEAYNRFIQEAKRFPSFDGLVAFAKASYRFDFKNETVKHLFETLKEAY